MVQIDLLELALVEDSILNSGTIVNGGGVCGILCTGGNICGWWCSQ